MKIIGIFSSVVSVEVSSITAHIALPSYATYATALAARPRFTSCMCSTLWTQSVPLCPLWHKYSPLSLRDTMQLLRPFIVSLDDIKQPQDLICFSSESMSRPWYSLYYFYPVDIVVFPEPKRHCTRMLMLFIFNFIGL